MRLAAGPDPIQAFTIASGCAVVIAVLLLASWYLCRNRKVASYPGIYPENQRCPRDWVPETGLRISKSSPDISSHASLNSEGSPSRAAAAKRVFQISCGRQWTLPTVPQRHLSFQRMLSHRLDMSNIEFTVQSIKHKEQPELGSIKPELYKQVGVVQKELCKQGGAVRVVQTGECCPDRGVQTGGCVQTELYKQVGIVRFVQTGGCRQSCTNRWVSSELYKQVGAVRVVQTGGCRQSCTNRWVPSELYKQVGVVRVVQTGGCCQSCTNRWVPPELYKQMGAVRVVQTGGCRQSCTNRWVPSRQSCTSR